MLRWSMEFAIISIGIAEYQCSWQSIYSLYCCCSCWCWTWTDDDDDDAGGNTSVVHPRIDRSTAPADTTDHRPDWLTKPAAVRSCTVNWRLRIRHRGPGQDDALLPAAGLSIARRPPVSARSIFQSASCKTGCSACTFDWCGVFFDRRRFVILRMCACIHACLHLANVINPRAFLRLWFPHI